MNKCSICKNSKETINLNCDHCTCSKCLHREIFYNFEEFIKSEKFDEDIDLKCIICEKGTLKLNKNKILDILESDLAKKVEVILKCGKCPEDSSNKVEMFCKTCKLYLCVSCFLSHTSKHNLTNELEMKNLDNFCIYHTDEELKLECRTCSLPLCLICREINHQGHKIEYIKDSYQNKKEKIIENLLFKKFDELESHLNREKEKILIEINNRSDTFISNIHSLISTLHDLIIQYKTKISFIEENFKNSIKIFKNLFKNFYDDLNETSIQDYHSLHLHSKLPESLNHSLNFIENSHIKLYEFDNTIKITIEKLKDEIKNMKEIQVENNGELNIIKNISCNYKCVQSMKMDNYVDSIIETKEGLIVTAGNNKIKLWEIKNNNFSLVSTLPENGYDFMPIIQIETGELVFYNIEKQGLVFFDNKTNLFSRNLNTNGKIDCLLSIENNIFIYNLEKNIVINNTRVTGIFSFLQICNTTCLKGHSNNVTSLLYVPEKNYIISGSEDKSIIVWDRHKLCSINTLNGHNDTIYSLLLLNNSKFASGCSSFIIIWSLDDFKCLKTIKAHSGRIVSLRQLGNGYFVSASQDKTIKIWNSDQEYECVKTFTESSEIYSLEISKNYDIITSTDHMKLNFWTTNY
jgi:WD40 repeat protein